VLQGMRTVPERWPCLPYYPVSRCKISPSHRNQNRYDLLLAEHPWFTSSPCSASHYDQALNSSLAKLCDLKGVKTMKSEIYGGSQS
jgi:hypothetical protein